MFNIDFAVGVFRHVYLVNVWGIVSAAKCVCTNYQSPDLVCDILELIGLILVGFVDYRKIRRSPYIY